MYRPEFYQPPKASPERFPNGRARLTLEARSASKGSDVGNSSRYHFSLVGDSATEWEVKVFGRLMMLICLLMESAEESSRLIASTVRTIMFATGNTRRCGRMTKVVSKLAKSGTKTCASLHMVNWLATKTSSIIVIPFYDKRLRFRSLKIFVLNCLFLERFLGPERKKTALPGSTMNASQSLSMS